MSQRISVIIPSYNFGQFIETTLESILNQGYQNFECIVMDGGSTDGTLEILKKYEDRITWRSEKDKGQSDAINKGMKLASGEIIAYLNADDVYEKDCFIRVAEFFKNNPDTKWAFGKCRVIDDKGNEIYRTVTWFKNLWLNHYSYNRLLVLNFLSQPAMFWRKTLVEEIGYFEVDEHLVMDYEFWLRAGKKYQPGYIPDYLACFRIHPLQKSSVNPTKATTEGMRVVKKYTESSIIIFIRYIASLCSATFYFVSNFAYKIKNGLKN
jgi:glycosyltransferase involved in cell wall biosynthesis